jgi:polyvinyl alcohol dehydrogenase (cytochrome)
VSRIFQILSLLLTAGIVTAPVRAQAPPDGAALFQTHCAACHEGAAAASSRAPARAALAQKSQEEILLALESGPMVIYGNRMSEAERHTVAAFLSSNTASTAALSRANLCATKELITPAGVASPENWNGWGLDVANSRYQTHTSISAGNVASLKLKWAFGIPDASTAYGQPTVVAGRVFFGSGDGAVYALNAASGCTIWTYKAETTVRTAVTVAPAGKGRYLAYFGDGEANLYAVDAESGKLAWKVKVDSDRSARITGAPQLYRHRLYVPVASNEELNGGDPNYPCCTFRGNVVAVDALTGRRIWKAYAIAEKPGPSKPGTSHAKFSPAGAAIWDAPTIDSKRGVLYVGTGDAYVDPAADGTDAIVAFDLATGKRLWVQQKTPNDVFNFGCIDPRHFNCPERPGPDVDFGSSPILQDLGNGHRVLLAGQKTGVMYGLDPDDGGKEGSCGPRQRAGRNRVGISYGRNQRLRRKFRYFHAHVLGSGSPTARRFGGHRHPHRQARLENDASKTRLPRQIRMQRRTARRCDGSSRPRLFRLDGWPPPGLFRERRQDRMGFRYVARFPHGQRGKSPRRLDER